MKITTVHYSALINLGNYQNEKIGFTAEIGESETVEQAIEALRQKVLENGGHNAEELYQTLREGEYKLRELERKIRQATEQWNQTAEFLRTQGIKTDAADLPQFTNLLPGIKSESRVEYGEIEAEF